MTPVAGKKGEPARLTKVPYTIANRKASSTDPSTWTTYEEAKKAATLPNSKFSGIGIVFDPSQTLLGIDIDHVLDDKGKLLPEYENQITALIKRANTYTELSPSGTGMHLLLRLTGPLTLIANRHAPFEAYTSGRFFTVTENVLSGTRPARLVSPEEAQEILAITGYPWNKANDMVEVEVEIKDGTPVKANGVKIEERANHGQSSLLSQPLMSELLDDDTLLQKMFASKNGPKIRALYDGNTDEYQNDLSRADSALLSHLAFWSQRDPSQMERLWLASPLGSRPKTRTRKDYRARTIQASIASCKETYTAHRPHSSDHELISADIFDSLDLLYTFTEKKDKSYTQNSENMFRILTRHPEFKDTLRYDAFTNRMEIRSSAASAEETQKEKWRPYEDHDTIIIQNRISVLFDFFRKVSKDMVQDAITRAMKANTIDSAQEYIRSIVWDQTPRLDQWLTLTYGAEDNVYHRAIASNWLKGLVKRIMVPGCKFDYVLVLEGKQGSKKSTSLHILGRMPSGDSWHVETTMSTDSKDFFMQFAGKAIIEFSEGETLSRTEVKKMKAIITMQSDKYREPYSRTSIDHPRHCVFAMTTNQEEYLKDETGNRRWLPVKVILPEADIEWLEANRDQLLAEAYHRVITLNESVHDFPLEDMEREQNARRVSDPNEDLIMDWYFNDQFKKESRDEGITTQMVYNQALSGFGAMKRYDEMAIADVLKRVLKLEKRRKMVNGVQANRWYPPAHLASPLTLELDAEAHETHEVQKEVAVAQRPPFNAAEHGFEDDEIPFGDDE